MKNAKVITVESVPNTQVGTHSASTNNITHAIVRKQKTPCILSHQLTNFFAIAPQLKLPATAQVNCGRREKRDDGSCQRDEMIAEKIFFTLERGRKAKSLKVSLKLILGHWAGPIIFLIYRNLFTL